MPSARPIAPSPSARFGRTDTSMPWPIGSLRGAEHLDEVRRHRLDVRRERAASRPRSTTSTFSTHQPSPATRPATSASSSHRVGVAVAARRSRGTACRDRAGRPGRAARRRPRARPRRRRSGRRAAARRRSCTPPSTSGGSSPNGCTSKPSPTRFLIVRVPLRAAPARARGRRRSVSLRLRRSPSTTTTVPPSASTSAASSVSTPPTVCAARSASARNACGVCTRDEAVARTRSRRRGRRRTRFTVSDDRQRGHCAVGAVARPRAMTRVEQPRATRAGAPRRARPRCRRRRERSASPARTESERVAPPTATLHAGGRVPVARRRGSTTTTPSHARRATPTARSSTLTPPSARELLGRAEARAAAGRDDDRPGLHRGSLSPVARRAVRDGLSRRRGGRTAGGRRWSARPT